MFATSTPDIATCGSIVADSCQRRHGLLLGSGTTALSFACRMTPPDRKKVIVPAIACAHVLFAILYANCTPVFVDICLESGLIDPDLVRAEIELDPAIGAVVVVHTYGHIAEIQKICNHAKACGVLVIEDAAQAQGGVYADGSPVGSHGDLSLVSFGHTKILDAGGGGVLMTDRQDLYEASLAFEKELSTPPAESLSRFAQYRSRYYTEWNARISDSSALNRIGMLHKDFSDIFVCRADDETARRIVQALPSLPFQVAARVEMAAEYTNLFASLNGVQLCRVRSGYIPWRFVFRVMANERDTLLNNLRQAGLDASSWYPSLALFWHQDSVKFSLPNADTFSQEVVNLWVTPGYDRRQIHVAFTLVRDYCEKAAPFAQSS